VERDDDPHLELKQTYWDIKYREWRPFVLVAPFLTFFFGGLFVFILFPRTLTAIKELPVEHVVSKDIVKEVIRHDILLITDPPISDPRIENAPCTPPRTIGVRHQLFPKMLALPACKLTVRVLNGTANIHIVSSPFITINQGGSYSKPLSLSPPVIVPEHIGDSIDYDIDIE
jgi:hypothetical protein